ncbi:MAG: bacillithiol system redox-active protein YtxJ [Candidatus Omnitrophota bacterium]
MKIYFKHSTRCPVSLAAKKEMDLFLEHHPNMAEYELIDVLTNRGRSNEIAEKYAIRHESPQIIIVDDTDQVIWNASHRAITEESINRSLHQ